MLNTVRKGDPIIVTGRIATRRFEKDGATQYFTEVKADFVGLDVARTGARFTRSRVRTDGRATDAAEGTDLAAPADGQQSDLQEPGVDGERPARLGGEPAAAHRPDGVLVSVD